MNLYFFVVLIKYTYKEGYSVNVPKNQDGI